MFEAQEALHYQQAQVGWSGPAYLYCTLSAGVGSLDCRRDRQFSMTSQSPIEMESDCRYSTIA